MQLNASATLPAPINVAKSDQSPLRRHLVSLAKLLGKFAMSPDAMLDGLGRAGVSDDDARATLAYAIVMRLLVRLDPEMLFDSRRQEVIYIAAKPLSELFGDDNFELTRREDRTEGWVREDLFAIVKVVADSDLPLTSDDIIGRLVEHGYSRLRSVKLFAEADKAGMFAATPIEEHPGLFRYKLRDKHLRLLTQPRKRICHDEEGSKGSRASKENYRWPDDYERDEWICEQKVNRRKNQDIIDDLFQNKNGWMPVRSPNGLRGALRRFCKHTNRPVPYGRPGRQAKSR